MKSSVEEFVRAMEEFDFLAGVRMGVVAPVVLERICRCLPGLESLVITFGAEERE